MQDLTLLIDKSAFQSLSRREAKWMFHHFRMNVPPVFFAEIIADLKKKKPATGSAETDVKALAGKITSHAIHTNVGAQELMTSELLGNRFPLGGQIIDINSEIVTLQNGERAIYVDSTPTQDMIHRWQHGDFSELEHEQAAVWRDGISKIQLEDMFRKVKALRNPNVKNSDDLIRVVDGALKGRDFALMKDLFQMANLDDVRFNEAARSWRGFGHPPTEQFFPYSYFILRIELYFLLGLANKIITTRDTNRIDIEYLKYLPFAHAFCSSDNLHIESARHFSMPHNMFILGKELKSALAEIADCWDSVSDKVKSRGTASFANFPPPELDNAITRAYDFHIKNWREGANEPRPQISPEENARTMARLKPLMEAMERARKKSNPKVD